MSDGFYSNDDDHAPGCFGGYGSDGSWAYADDSGSGFEARPSDALKESGAFGQSMERPRKRFPSFFRAGGDGGYSRAA